MKLLRWSSKAFWALGIGIAMTALLPLSHMSMDHAEDCPLCHLGSDGLEPAVGLVELADGSDPRLGWILPTDDSLPDCDPLRRPPGRAPPFLRMV